jgi:hypothetical protein
MWVLNTRTARQCSGLGNAKRLLQSQYFSHSVLSTDDSNFTQSVKHNTLCYYWANILELTFRLTSLLSNRTNFNTLFAAS